MQKTDEKTTDAKESSKTDADATSTGTNDTEDEDGKKSLNITDTRTTLEERRKSLLDHHWAIPSKDRYVVLEIFNITFHMFVFAFY